MPQLDHAKDAAATLEELRLDSDRRLSSLGLALMLVPSLWFIRTDFQLYGHDWQKLQQRLLLRLVLILVPAFGVLAIRASKTREAYSRAVFWSAIVIGAVTLGLNFMRPAGSGLPLRSPFLILAIMYFAMPDTPVRQIAAPFGLSAGLIALRLTVLRGGGVDVGGDVIVIVAVNALGILAVLRRIRLEVATSEVVGELRTLRGIIPICSHCRKLRSEVGDWQMIERYFQDHSEALFSHGICPDCMREHYPEPHTEE